MMHFLLSWIFLNIIVPFVAFWRRFTTPTNHAVSRVDLEYSVRRRSGDDDVTDAFWREQCDFWEWFSHGGDELNYMVSLDEPREYTETTKPACVTRVIARVKYWYDGKSYKFITNDLNHAWPPVQKTAGVSFSVPLARAYLCDANGKPARDVTAKLKKYGGPKGDFHGQAVPLRDLFTYTEDVLKREFPVLRVTNAIGLQRELSTVDDSTLSLV